MFYFASNQLKNQAMQNINEVIQARLIANPKLDRKALAIELNTTDNTVRANFISLISKKIIVNYKTIKKVNKAIESIGSVFDVVKEAKKQAKKQVKKENNTYVNHDGVCKEEARVKIVNSIVESGVIGLAASLPNTGWVIEQAINNKVKGIEFIGVERKKVTFNKMRTNLRNLKKDTDIKGETYFGNIGDILYGKLENTYAHLILDYCGNLATISKELEYCINNDVIKLNSIMAVTFAKPIRGVDFQSDKLRQLGAINNTDDRCQSDRSVEAYFYKICGWNYQVVEFFYYKDRYPMTLVIIKRIK
jgi:hypothetical protein